MTGAAIRSRLLQLRRDRKAAAQGHDLLEQKREVLLRELLRREETRREAARRAEAALDHARRRMALARVELSRSVVEAAALAQAEIAHVDRRETRLLGVALPALAAQVTPYRPAYGTAATARSLDEAGIAYAGAVPSLVALAQEDQATLNLRAGLARTLRRLNALERVVIPDLDRNIRAVATALEEEERDEAFRRKRRLARLGPQGAAHHRRGRTRVLSCRLGGSG